MFSSGKFQNVALLLLRFIIAAIFLFSGTAKWIFWSGLPAGMPAMSDAMLNLMKFLSIVEPLGAIALIVGFLTWWASLGLAIIMVGAMYVLHFQMQVPFFSVQIPGVDYVTLILVGCLVLLAFGPGKWALDAQWRRK